MYSIFVDMTFDAQHRLTFADGSREPLHAHDWKVRAAISSETLDKNGLVFDFEQLKALMDRIVKDLRGQRLESLEQFANQNASAETVARFIYEQLAPRLPVTVRLEWIEVTEAPGCRARYRHSS